MSRLCPCSDSRDLNLLKRILYREIDWFKSKLPDEDFLYDESWTQFIGLSRGECCEILKILSKD